LIPEEIGTMRSELMPAALVAACIIAVLSIMFVTVFDGDLPINVESVHHEESHVELSIPTKLLLVTVVILSAF
jgi:hypothetical protein